MSDPQNTAATQLRIADLPARKPTRFTLTPTGSALTELRDGLGLSGLSKLRFSGQIAPSGQRDWLLTARLGATVVQPCTVSLAPVTTRIDEDVTRRYSPNAEIPEAELTSEMEMPEDDTLEPVPTVLDLSQVMAEALSLALPLYPRAEGIETLTRSAEPKGAEPITDDALKPFAGLAALRDSLAHAADPGDSDQPGPENHQGSEKEGKEST